jgi:hypothetical protein
MLNSESQMPHAKEQLLAEVLAEREAGSFREALLTETLGLVRQRRRLRQAWRAGIALVLAGGLGVVLWRSPQSPVMAPPKQSRAYATVFSQPLPAAALVSTQPFAASQVVTSTRNAEVVRTASGEVKPREIDDSELLALLGTKPAALVWLAPHSAELVFVDPKDREDVVRN